MSTFSEIKSFKSEMNIKMKHFLFLLFGMLVIYSCAKDDLVETDLELQP